MSHTPGKFVLRPNSNPLDKKLAALDRSHQQRQNGTAKVHKLAPPPRPKRGAGS